MRAHRAALRRIEAIQLRVAGAVRGQTPAAEVIGCRACLGRLVSSTGLPSGADGGVSLRQGRTSSLARRSAAAGPGRQLAACGFLCAFAAPVPFQRGERLVVGECVPVGHRLDVAGFRRGSSCPRSTGRRASVRDLVLIFAQASVALLAPGVELASRIAALISLSSSCGRLTLPCWRMLFPLKVASSIDWGSGKSLNHPTLGHSATLALRARRRTSCRACPAGRSGSSGGSRAASICFWKTSAVFLPGSAFVATVSTLSLPVYLP